MLEVHKVAEELQTFSEDSRAEKLTTQIAFPDDLHRKIQQQIAPEWDIRARQNTLSACVSGRTNLSNK
jgi:hypothetical protein